jgi:hypothetical protein
VNVVQWASYQVGHLVTAPGGAGGQCVDLCNVYIMARGKPAVRRNALDWAAAGAIAGWTWVPNSPTNHPALGDVVVWRANVPAVGVGQYGHVALCLAADPMAILTLDQDWPAGAAVGVVWHRYDGVAGWWVAPIK